VRERLELDLAGGPATVDLSVAPLTRGDGRVVGVAGVAYDLTQKVRARRFQAASPPRSGG
jgi:hypothetical protein